MNKQEVIRKAWEKHGMPMGKYIDENGYMLADNKTNVPDFVDKFYMETKYRYNRKMFQFTLIGFRPIELENLESNNGWVKIESEADLPKDTEENLIYNFITTTGKMIIGYYNRRLNFICKYGTEQGIYGITHYQPITKPLKHIY